MVVSCVAYGCNNGQDYRKIPFHTFPIKRPNILKLWIQAIGRDNWKPSKTSRLCGEHFLPSDYIIKPGMTKQLLKYDAVPSRFSFPNHLLPKVTMPGRNIVKQTADCNNESMDIDIPSTSSSIKEFFGNETQTATVDKIDEIECVDIKKELFSNDCSSLLKIDNEELQSVFKEELENKETVEIKKEPFFSDSADLLIIKNEELRSIIAENVKKEFELESDKFDTDGILSCEIDLPALKTDEEDIVETNFNEKCETDANISPKRKKRPKKPYTQDDINNAVAAVHTGMSISNASKVFNVPRMTLSDKYNGKHSLQVGLPTILSTEEEQILVNWALKMTKQGFQITKDQLCDGVQQILCEFQRPNTFVNNRPGRNWCERFMRRHPELSLLTTQHLSKPRSNVSEAQIRAWFAEIRIFLEENGYLDILSDPRRVYNCDETAFFLSPNGQKIFAKKGSKIVYSFAAPKEKDCLTALIMCNASGELPPPLVVYDSRGITKLICAKFPNGWSIGSSNNGWMTPESFFEYITKSFNQWLDEQNIQRPIILFVDGHTSHLTFQLSRFCSENGIILISFFPNSTHILQPLDVAIFHSLKSEYKNLIQNWRVANLNEPFGKENFAPILEEALMFNTNFPISIKDGFRTCGLLPFNPDNIRFEKFFKTDPNYVSVTEQTINVGEVVLTAKEKRKFLKYFEQENITKMDDFKKSGPKWSGNLADKELFVFWKKIKGEEIEENIEENVDQLRTVKLDEHIKGSCR